METIPAGYLREQQKEEKRRQVLREASASIFGELESAVLEIGSGHGHFLSDFAEANPEKSCIGIDLLSGRITKANRKRNKRELNKLSFIKAEAIEFLETLPEQARFSLIFVLFPDPWPKKRHFRRRLIQAHTLGLLKKYSLAETKLCIRTDHQGYLDWAKEQIQAHPSWTIDTHAPWPFEAGSYFQSLMTDYQSLIATPGS